MTKAVALSKGAPIVIAGDFDAPHNAWGYPRQSTKSNLLVQAVADCSLELIMDSQYPTRTGTSVVRDTTPDLAVVKNAPGAGWQNLQENLDLSKAVDNISHRFVLDAISDLGLGPRFHAYVSSFLRDRKATVKIGQIKSKEYTSGARGTPQEAVIFPLGPSLP
ncbi:uncharacterized protein LOC142591606 [Dermacentor variabilis]|uniref:uncharacterized protein LOC142591606 n=1 Tax=Dermacentor variabilis TaxID=34621 RepID=UPI003F5B6071